MQFAKQQITKKKITHNHNFITNVRKYKNYRFVRGSNESIII